RTMLPSTIVIILLLLVAFPPVSAIDPLWTYSTQGAKIGGVAVSSDGSGIAVGAEKVLLVSKNGELLAKEAYGDQVLFTPNGANLLTSYGSSVYFFVRNATQSPLNKKWDYELPDKVRSIDISDDGTIIVAAGESGGTYVFSGTGKMTGSNANYSAVLRVSSNGQRILGASAGSLCRYSSTGTGYCYDNVSMVSQPDVMEMPGSGGTVIFNDDQQLVAVNTYNGAERWKKRATSDITALAMISSGTKILVGTMNGNIDLFDDKGNLSWTFATNPGGRTGIGVREVALSRDGKIAAAGTYEGKTVALDAAGHELWSNVTKDHINHIAMSGDGSLVIAAGEETVYAFSSSAQYRPATLSSQETAHAAQNISTLVPATTLPQTSGEMTRSATPATRPVSTTYSVIRTATQSPVPALIPLLGLLGAAFVLRKE
ncbi:MAG: PQQ-binding-like beta-propeller repeat protein, partial [Methanoregula sp.]